MSYNLLSGFRIWPVLAITALLLLVSGCGGNSGEALLERGLKALAEDQIEEAVDLLGRAEKKLPDNPSVFCNLGVAYWKDEQYELAVLALRRSAELADSEAEPLEFLGNVFVEIENWDDALQSFELAMDRSGRTARLLTAMSVVKLHTQDFIEARLLLSEALKQDPDYMPALYNMAVLYRDRAGNVKEAGKYFRRFVDATSDPTRIGPPVDEVYITSAEAFLGPDKEPEGQEDLMPPEKVLEDIVKEPTVKSAKPIPEIHKPTVKRKEISAKTEPVDVEKLLAEAEKAIEKEEFVTAKIKISKAREMDPENPEPLWQLAMLYDKHLDFTEKAEAIYKEFKLAFPDDRRSKLIMQLKPKAKEPVRVPKPISERRSDVSKNNAQAVFDRAYDAHEKDNWDEAIAGYKKTLELNSKRHDAIYNMALAYKKKGDLNNAKVFFKKSTVVQPELVKAWYMLALVHKELMEYKEAISAVGQALDLDPGYEKAHYLLGLVYSMSGRPDLAKGCFVKCVESSPGSPIAASARAYLDDLP